jgi:hypothetical protein
MKHFENIVRLRGYLSSDPLVPTPEATISSSHIMLTLHVESSTRSKKTSPWVVTTLNLSIICSGPDFAGVTLDMQIGDYVEIEGEIIIFDSDHPITVRGKVFPKVRNLMGIRAVLVRKLDLSAGIAGEVEDGSRRPASFCGEA